MVWYILLKTKTADERSSKQQDLFDMNLPICLARYQKADSIYKCSDQD